MGGSTIGIDLNVLDNGDHTCLVWMPLTTLGGVLSGVPGCRGFTIRRVRAGQTTYLHGLVGFSDSDILDPANPWKFPVQRFMWWDYGVAPGDTVQYQVVPVTGSQGNLSLDEVNASPMTDPMTITGQATAHMAAYFNKGIVASQWVSQALATQPKGAQIRDLVATPGNTLRNALSGLLRPQILALLADAKANGGKIYAALYELNDQELIPALVALGQNCNLILGNGAFKSDAPGENDENAAVRASLQGQINLSDRIVTLGHFAHNKFVVFCDSNGNPQKVLTGSTNWTSSGLCTQANNGIIINDAGVAADYLAAWTRLKAAGNTYAPPLIPGNSVSTSHQIDGCNVNPWFVTTSAAQDLVQARDLISKAKEGILFLFFNPGIFETDPNKWTLLQTILDRHNPTSQFYNAGLYMRGVVNQDIPMLTEGAKAPGSATAAIPPAVPPTEPTGPNSAPVTLVSSGVEPPTQLSHDVLVPHNIKTGFHEWETQLLGASMVNIHSKVIILDPFGASPVVMTGSHNLGHKASSMNDDNLIIIQGSTELATAYAINIIAIYQTYRWNSYVEAHRQDPTVWHGLVDNDQWQADYLAGDHLKELNFWMGAGT